MDKIHIRLRGGPSDLASRHEWETTATDPAELMDRITVPFRAGYEHFEYRGTEETDESGRRFRFYEWTYRTRIAE